MPRIQLDRIQKRFGSNTVVDLTLEIEPGEYLVLIGPSGSGKSTTLRLIAGLETLTSGSILVDGQPLSTLPPHERNVSLVFQDHALYPHMDVYKNIAMGLHSKKTPQSHVQESVQWAANLLQISHLLTRMPENLSGGERQRVALGRALVRRPQILLLDEPLSNLDPQLRNELQLVLTNIHRELGCSTIHVTHDQREALSQGDRIALLRNGVVEQIGISSDLLEHPETIFAAQFMADLPMLFLPLSQIRDQNPDYHDLLVSERGIGPELDMLAGIRPEFITITPRSVDSHTPNGIKAEIITQRSIGQRIQVTVKLDDYVARVQVHKSSFPDPNPKHVTLVIASRDILLYDQQTGQIIDQNDG